MVASFIVKPLGGDVKAINGVLDQYKNWAFVLAFTSIGLDTNFKSLFKQMQGGKVLWLYIIGQVFNILLTLFAVWFLLSGVAFLNFAAVSFICSSDKTGVKMKTVSY